MVLDEGFLAGGGVDHSCCSCCSHHPLPFRGVIVGMMLVVVVDGLVGILVEAGTPLAQGMMLPANRGNLF